MLLLDLYHFYNVIVLFDLKHTKDVDHSVGSIYKPSQ